MQRGSHVNAGQLLVDARKSATSPPPRSTTKAPTPPPRPPTPRPPRPPSPKKPSKAQLDLAQAKANLDLNQSIVNGRTQLFAQGAIPGRDLDTAKAALVQAQAAYDIASQAP